MNDYPAEWATATQDSLLDTWGYYNRECTSWAAWKLHEEGFEMGYAVGNANAWDDWARNSGYAVDGNPVVGAVAESDAGDYGHVATVAAVNGDGTITIDDYNSDFGGTFAERVVPAVNYVYLHLASGT